MGELALCSRTRCWVAILICVFEFSAAAQTTPKPGFSENVLWAKLQAPLDTAGVKVGDPVQAQVLRPWSAEKCVLLSGSILQGKVAAFSPWSTSSKSIEVSIAFTAKCFGGPTVPVKLIAALYPVEGEKSQMDLYTAMPTGIGPGASGRQSTDLGTLPSPGMGSQPDLPSSVKIGRVAGIRHLSLNPATGSGHITVLSGTDRRIRLQRDTRLAFQAITASP